MVLKLTWTYKSFNFGSQYNLTNSQTEKLIEIFNKKIQPKNNSLDGRNEFISTEIKDIGNVVVKSYLRGGLARYLQRKRYLKIGETRCQQEYEMLVRLRNEKVNVPDPVAFVWKGRPFYKCWLITKQISNHKSIADIAQTDISLAEKYTMNMIDQLMKMIRLNIYHVDLHPGNVIVDDNEKVYIIDFDKAVQFNSGRDILRDKYIARWKRAVTKHNLPENLGTIVQKELANISLCL